MIQQHRGCFKPLKCRSILCFSVQNDLLKCYNAYRTLYMLCHQTPHTT